MTVGAITYRDIAPRDFKALHGLVSIWEVTRNLGTWPWPADETVTRSRCVAFEGAGFCWGICKDNTLIGTVGVKDGGLGYMLHPDHQRQGIIAQAVKDALATAFGLADLDTVRAHIWADNAPSRHILEKSGFEFEGTETVHALARNGPTPRETYGLTRARWSALMHACE